MRSDNDNWDINTSVGATALFVAMARALEAQKPHPLAVDSYAELFCRAAGFGDVLDGNNLEHPLKTSDFGEHFVTYQGARTKYFDEYFRRAADAGVRQVVILAAGLDSRAYRLPWPDGTTVFELDRPQILAFKGEVLSAHGARPHVERREIAVDLRDDWQQALRDSGFDPATPSAWIAEGLMIYLPASAREQLYTGIDGLASFGSHVAIEDSVPLDEDDFAARLAEERAASGPNQGPFFQLIYNEQCEPATAWFSKRGWVAVGTPLIDCIHQAGRPIPAPDSEVRSIVDRNTLVSACRTT